jgi:hypothetical protein
MHPEITRRLATHRRAELAHEMSMIRNARLLRGASKSPSGRVPTATGRRVPGWLRGLRPSPARALARAAHRATPAVFVAEPEAFGIRAYLTTQETSQLMAEWAQHVARYADRLDDPARRPAGAQPFELLILGREVPALAPGAVTRLGASG